MPCTPDLTGLSGQLRFIEAVWKWKSCQPSKRRDKWARTDEQIARAFLQDMLRRLLQGRGGWSVLSIELRIPTAGPRFLTSKQVADLPKRQATAVVVTASTAVAGAAIAALVAMVDEAPTPAGVVAAAAMAALVATVLVTLTEGVVARFKRSGVLTAAERSLSGPKTGRAECCLKILSQATPIVS